MEGASKELLDVIYGLLPGFVACWIFYGLTAHPKASVFERVVQALIFTIFIRGIVTCLRAGCLWVGRWYSFGDWTDDSTLVASIVTALLFGLLLARMTNSGCVHDWLREWKWYDKRRDGIKARFKWVPIPTWHWTERSSLPSEWFSAFHGLKRNVVLHLVGGRRLYGWPIEWSDSPDKGHIILMDAQWLLRGKKIGEVAPLHTVERIMVSAKDVEMVEFLKQPDQISVGSEELERVELLLLKQKPERSENHGRKISTESSEPGEQRAEPAAEDGE